MDNLEKLAAMNKLATKKTMVEAFKDIAPSYKKMRRTAQQAKVQKGPKGANQFTMVPPASAADEAAAAKKAFGSNIKQVLPGVAAGGLTIAALAKALKRGGSAPAIVSKSNKKKLIEAMKKNPKTTAAAGGVGALGLASLLKD